MKMNYQKTRSGFNLSRATLGVFAFIILAAIAACSPSTSTPTANVPKVTDVPQQTATPTQLDPCQLISSQEASALAGTTYGAGKESTSDDGIGRICTYSANNTNIFLVIVAQAPDVATAQSYKAKFMASLPGTSSAKGLTTTELPNFADGGAMAEESYSEGGETINAGALYFLKGTVFFGFSVSAVNGTAPTADAMQAEAQTVLGRLP